MIQSEIPLNGSKIALASSYVLFPGVIPHKQGKRQLPLVASRFSNRARACSTGRVGKAVGVGDVDGVLLGWGVNVSVGVALWVGLVVGVGVLAEACPQAVSRMSKVKSSEKSVFCNRIESDCLVEIWARRGGKISFMNQKMIELMKTLPPITACVVWDVVCDRITLQTIELAGQATDQEWESYDIVRCIAAGNPEYLPTVEAKVLVEIMLAEFDVARL